MELQRRVGFLSGEIFGGLAAVLVALPSAIAYGLVVYGPLGPDLAQTAVVAGVAGTVFIGLIAALFGGTPGLISAPCAPAAAVLSVFALELLKDGRVDPASIPVYLAITGFVAGVSQLLLGLFKGGRLIKYIPYPVVAGYLSGVGLLIVIGQTPKFFGFPKESGFWKGLLTPSSWHWESLVVGGMTVLTMLLAPRLTKRIPAAIIALAVGVLSYFGLAVFEPRLLLLEHNKLLIGPLTVSAPVLVDSVRTHWFGLTGLSPQVLLTLIVPSLTLAALLSIDTLKTCVILDAMTGGRHDSDREIRGQGLANMISASFSGMPGAGTMGATLVNRASGGTTKLSGVFSALFGIAVLFLFGKYIAWIPVAVLAGILYVVGIRMVDAKALVLLRHKTTRLDFVVILAVIISALSFSLLTASAVGIGMAVVLFLREQVRSSVIRRKLDGTKIFSKKRRLADEMALLERYGSQTSVVELQGQLFFGTADRLYTEIEMDVRICRRVIIDMRRVQSVDYTAVSMLKQLYGKAKENGGILAFSSVPQNLPTGLNVNKYFRYLGLVADDEHLHFFQDLDSALEWAEDALLAEHRPVPDALPIELEHFDFFRGLPSDVLEQIRDILEDRCFRPGETVFRAGDVGDEVYFIRKGVVKIRLPAEGSNGHYLATLQRGDFFGEMSFLDKETRSADAVVETETCLYVLSQRAFNGLRRANPSVSGLLFARLAAELSRRLRQNHVELKALAED